MDISTERTFTFAAGRLSIQYGYGEESSDLYIREDGETIHIRGISQKNLGEAIASLIGGLRYGDKTPRKVAFIAELSAALNRVTTDWENKELTTEN